jgi:hypothetical protein
MQENSQHAGEVKEEAHTGSTKGGCLGRDVEDLLAPIKKLRLVWTMSGCAPTQDFDLTTPLRNHVRHDGGDEIDVIAECTMLGLAALRERRRGQADPLEPGLHSFLHKTLRNLHKHWNSSFLH